MMINDNHYGGDQGGVQGGPGGPRGSKGVKGGVRGVPGGSTATFDKSSDE